MDRFFLIVCCALFVFPRVIDRGEAPSALARLAESLNQNQPMPADGQKLHVTIIEGGDQLQSMFAANDWLNWFRRSSHYTTLKPSDPRFIEYLARFIPANELPALLVTAPSNGDMRGEVVYFATALDLPADASALANQLAKQLSKYQGQRVRRAVYVPRQYVRLDGQQIYEQYNPAEPPPERLPVVVPSNFESDSIDALALLAVGVVLFLMVMKKGGFKCR